MFDLFRLSFDHYITISVLYFITITGDKTNGYKVALK